MKSKINIFLSLVLGNLFFINAQTEYAGVEIGGKGLKVTIIKIIDVEIGEFEIVKSWTRNTNVTKNISSDGQLLLADIDDTSYAVLDIIDQLKKEHKIVPKNIFVVASSSVAVAKNKNLLAEKINKLTSYKLAFLTPDLESKLIAKGAIPQSKYDNSLIIDIGSGNTKGGYVEIDTKTYNYDFHPFVMKLGSMSLTQKIQKKAGESSNFIPTMTAYQDTLAMNCKAVCEKDIKLKTKNNIYMLGGAVWAFISIKKPNETAAYQEFTYQELLDYKNDITYKYDTFRTVGYVSKDYERVFKTFSKEALISGANLMVSVTSQLDNPETKKFYFVRQGQIAWLVAYIVDSVREIQQ